MNSDTSERHLALVLLALTAATGLIDAICYLGMGHVLVANMTGNVVFLGFALMVNEGFTTTLVTLTAVLAVVTVGFRMWTPASSAELVPTAR